MSLPTRYKVSQNDRQAITVTPASTKELRFFDDDSYQQETILLHKCEMACYYNLYKFQRKRRKIHKLNSVCCGTCS